MDTGKFEMSFTVLLIWRKGLDLMAKRRNSYGRLIGKHSTAALRAFETKMEVTANNIANLNSDGFKKSRVELKEGPNGNVQVDVDRIDTPGHSVFSVEGGQETQRELSNVDLSEEITEAVVTDLGYGANLEAVKAQNDMLGTVLDILG